jgi:hypothetical protein
MQLTFVITDFVASSTHADGHMISVERIFQYIDSIDPETSEDEKRDVETRCARRLVTIVIDKRRQIKALGRTF